MHEIKSDFLIIGSGLAGLSAAIYASQRGTVSLVSKSKINISSTYWAQGGIAGAIGEDDSPKLHLEDTIRVGGELCNREVVNILVNEGIDRVNDLINLGMNFDKEKNEILLGMEGGHSRRRILHAGGDSTGSKVVDFLSKIAQSKKTIKIYQNTVVIELLSKDGVCYGANTFDWENRTQTIFVSPNTILATGGGSGIYSRTTNPYTSTGDGISLAYNIGAEICDMEFVQFHPTAFYSENDQTFLISEAVRGEGAYLVNGDGRRFMKHIHKDAELAPRDVVSKAIFFEIRNSKIKSVFLDLTHLDPMKIKERFKTIDEKALEYNIDITKNLIPVSPAAHYMIGGVKTDSYGETNIKGLFACGEVSSTGVHGANRLASNSLLECLVFSKRTIDKAITETNNYSNNIKLEQEEFLKHKIDNSRINDFRTLKNRISTLLNNNAGIIRNNEILKDALDEINKIKSYFTDSDFEYYSDRLKSIFDISEMIIKSALLREESRGTHQRSDFPKTKKDFLGHIIIKNSTEPYFESL